MSEHLYRKRIAPVGAAGGNVDDLVSKNVLAQLRRDPPPRPPAHADKSKEAGGAVEATDLISSMAKRLAGLEREMKERQGALQQVQADNVSLKSKLRVAEEEIAKRALASIEPRDDSSSAVMHLRAENLRLRGQLKYAWKQVAEIKTFLNDYGMVWVGEQEAEEELAAHGFGPTGAPLASPPAASGRSSSSSAAGPSGAPPPPRSEPGDPLLPRRRSHSGAAPGPSSAAAGAGSRPPSGSRKSGGAVGGGSGSRSHEAGAAGLSAAAAAALGRAGHGDGGDAAAAAGAPPPLASKRSSSFSSPLPPPAYPSGASASSSSSLPATPQPPPYSQRQQPPPAAAPPPSRPGLPVNLAELMAKVDELNDLAGDGVGQVVRDGAGGHVLATQAAVQLVIYRDGLQIHTHPARPFNDPASAAVLRDLMDGYFPYVLKRDFPDGVPLRVVDRLADGMDSSPMRRGGGGGGGGGGGNIHSWADIDANGGGGEPQSRDSFLSKLPQAVIKNGKVIEIRSDISKLMGGGGGGGGGAGGGSPGKGDVSVITTPVDALLSTLQRNHVGPSLPPPSRDGAPPAGEVTTLQVKSVDGKQTYILKMKYDDTIGSLRACLDAHHSKGGLAGVSYEMRSAFPARAYSEAGETLRQAGLVPNATLFLRPVV